VGVQAGAGGPWRGVACARRDATAATATEHPRPGGRPPEEAGEEAAAEHAAS